MDLVARFDAPEADGDDAPWPEQEDLPDAVRVTPAGPDALSPEPPGNTDVLIPAVGGGHTPREAPLPAGPDDEHYVPPAPPPLPKLKLATKLAWLALFAGPAYLLIATIVGWTVSGLGAFLSVAAFVGGFAVLVLRMDNGGPRDSGPDDGAVV
ncbi:MAG: hypothetical protein J2P26_04010 [Nocardiopsaceae bacterium]|nr:hypothetical protein [Nocardiopsaceae bacterium]